MKTWILDEEMDAANEAAMLDAARFDTQRQACDRVTATAEVESVKPVRDTLAEPEHDEWQWEEFSGGLCLISRDRKRGLDRDVDMVCQGYMGADVAKSIVNDHNRAPSLLAANRRLREALRDYLAEHYCDAGRACHCTRCKNARAALAESDGGN